MGLQQLPPQVGGAGLVEETHGEEGPVFVGVAGELLKVVVGHGMAGAGRDAPWGRAASGRAHGLAPAHRVVDALARRRVVEEQELLKIARVGLAVFDQMQLCFGKAMGFAREVEAEAVGLDLVGADQRVLDRREQREEQREHGHQHRQVGDVVDAAHAGAGREAGQQALHRPLRNVEAAQQDQRERDQQLGDVVHHVMTQLMAHHRADLGQAGAAQQVVVQAHRGGAEQARDVGTDAGGLARGVDLVDVVHRHAVGMGHLQHGGLDRAIVQRLGGVEQRRDVDRCQCDQQRHEADAQHGAPDPPAWADPADHRIQHRRDQREDQRVDAQHQQLLAEPGREGLGRHAVVLLADEAGIDRQRQGQHPGRHDIDAAEQRIAPQRATTHAGRPVAHAGGATARQHQRGNGQSDDQIGQLQPVAAFEVGVRLFHGLGRQPVQVGLGGECGVPRQGGAPGIVHGADLEAGGLGDRVGLLGLGERRVGLGAVGVGGMGQRQAEAQYGHGQPLVHSVPLVLKAARLCRRGTPAWRRCDGLPGARHGRRVGAMAAADAGFSRGWPRRRCGRWTGTSHRRRWPARRSCARPAPPTGGRA
mmetsp:Transcript_6193/g.24983  ORF Transcript_6193/g.24983 Transcript_6193/m.24983 type:complete len:589 (-) Transcript_6193:1334-3100(-)